MRTNRSFESAIYQAIFATKDGEWVECRIPFNDLEPTFRGRVLASAPPLDPAEVMSVGFLIADNKGGKFQLENAWIKAVKSSSASTKRPVIIGGHGGDIQGH